MPDWMGNAASRWQTAGSVPGTSLGTTVTGSATVNVKGVYTELSAATAQPADVLMLHIGSGSTVSTDYLFDLAIGAAGSEVPILMDLQLSGSSSATTAIPALSVTLPLSIPAGSRVSARLQGSVASATLRMVAYLLQGTFASPQTLGICTTWGATPATSRGTAMPTGQVGNADSAKQEFVASTPYPISALMLAFGNQGNGVRTSGNMLVDVFVGAVGSEVAIINDLMVIINGTNDLALPLLAGPFPVDIPAGSRISVGYRAASGTAATQAHDVAVYGFS